MKTLLALLCLFSASIAGAESCRLNGVPCDFYLTTGTATIPQPPAPPVSPPSPQPVPPAPAAPGDLFWSPMNFASLFPIPPITTSGPNGFSIQFVADGATYPEGVILKLIDESGGNIAMGKEVVIASAPHNFGAAVLQNGRAIGTSSIKIPLRFSTATSAPQSNDCELVDGGTYYINVRAYDGSSAISFQFTGAKRDPVSSGSSGR